MTRAQRRYGIVVVSLIAAAFLLINAGRWVASGCPIGIVFGSCESVQGGRKIFGSSDHLLTNIGLRANNGTTILDIEGRHIVVIGDEVAISKTEKFSLPASCKSIEFNVAGDSFDVVIDGQAARRIRP